jgi:choline-glycine betaine transporter
MIVAAIVLKPRDPKMTQMQAAMASAVPFAILMFVVAFGFAVLTYFMDVQKKAHEDQLAAQAKLTPKPKKKKKK